MELDDLKNAWREQPEPLAKPDDKEVIRKIIRRSNRGLDRMLLWELAVAIIVFSFTLVMYLLYPESFTLFHVKLILPAVVYAVPIYYRLYRSSRILRQIDLSGDTRSTLRAFLEYYTTTLRYYQWGAYAILLLQLALFYADPTFQRLSLFPQFLVTGFMLSVLLIVGPFVRRVYGSKTRAIRTYLAETENGHHELGA